MISNETIYIIIITIIIIIIIIIIVIIILNNKKSLQQLQTTVQGTMKQTPASVVKSMGNGGNQSANTLQQNTGQGTMQQTPASVVKSMGNGGNQSANTLPQTPALPKSGFYPNLTMGMGGGTQISYDNNGNEDQIVTTFTLPLFLPNGSYDQYPTLGGYNPGSFPASSQDMFGNYYGSFCANQSIYCQNNAGNYTNVKLYGTSGNTSNYLYVGCDFNLYFLNNGTTYKINLPLANPACWSNNTPSLNTGCANQINSGDNVSISLESNYGIQFMNVTGDTPPLWNFYYNVVFSKVVPGNFVALVYDDVNCNVFLAAENGNVYIYMSVPTFSVLSPSLQFMNNIS